MEVPTVTKEKSLNTKAMITYRRPTTITKYKHLALNKTKKTNYGSPWPCKHPAICCCRGKNNISIVPTVSPNQAKI